MIARIGRVLLWGALSVLLLGAGALAWLAVVPPPEFVPATRPQPDESLAGLVDVVVGWYEDDRGARRVLTWGAWLGVSMNRFEDPAQRFMLPVDADRFEWRIVRKPGDEPSARDYVQVVRDDAGEVSGLQWINHDGQGRSARRIEAGYTQREIRFNSRRGDVELVALLLIPASPGPHPGVAFIHGSGISDRDNFWYLYQADFLARRGIAVLLPDKRGCGASGGTWHDASFDDFAGDSAAAAEVLALQPDVDPDRVGLLGISQGGWIAPLAAHDSAAVNFVINVSGSATTPNEQIRHEIRADVRGGGAPGPVASAVAPVFVRRAKRKRPVWWEKNGAFDPLPHWSRVDVPVLVVYGRLDEDDNVPVQRSLDLLETVRNDRWTFHVYDDLGHGMIDAGTNWIRPEYLERLAGWIESNRPRSPTRPR